MQTLVHSLQTLVCMRGADVGGGGGGGGERIFNRMTTETLRRGRGWKKVHSEHRVAQRGGVGEVAVAPPGAGAREGGVGDWQGPTVYSHHHK